MDVHCLFCSWLRMSLRVRSFTGCSLFALGFRDQSVANQQRITLQRSAVGRRWGSAYLQARYAAFAPRDAEGAIWLPDPAKSAAESAAWHLGPGRGEGDL